MYFSCLEIAFSMGSQQLLSLLQAVQAISKDVWLYHGLVHRAREEACAEELDCQSVCALRRETKYYLEFCRIVFSKVFGLGAAEL